MLVVDCMDGHRSLSVFLNRALLVLALLGCPAAMAQQTPPPNFVIVLVDDVRWDGVGATGHAFVDTPAINQLAREGIVFRNAFVTTPLCSPSRASFLTGRYARATGIIDNGSGSLDDETTFAHLLEDAGYQTAFIGKWHMGSDASPRAAFTRWVSFSGQGQYQDQDLNIDGRLVPTHGYLTDVLNEHAVEFVNDVTAASQPFLLYLSHKAAHEPFVPPKRHRDRYELEAIRCSPGCVDPLTGKPALTRFVPDSEVPEPGRTGPSEEQIRNQATLLLSVDAGVGDIVRALRDAGVLDRTFILFTSDNGYFHGEHGLGDKRWAYEESVRIPFIVRYPPLGPRGSFRNELVANIDLAPTILELARLRPPDSMDGRSLVSLLSGPPGSWRSSFVLEYFDERPFPRIPTWEAIRSERFKLIRYPALGREFDELYDLAEDPYELVNQIGNLEYASRRERLESLLDDYLQVIPNNSRR